MRGRHDDMTNIAPQAASQQIPETKDIRKQILWLAIPIVFESIFALSGNVIFIALLSRIDSVGLDSIGHLAVNGMATIITGIVWWILKGMGIGATVRIAQAYGANDYDRINRISIQSLELQIFLGLLCSVSLYFLAGPLISFYSPEAESLQLAIRYIRICCLGFPFLGLTHAATGILQGLGDTKTPMKFSAILNLVFIVTGVPLIFGWLGEPLGVIGSAYALILGQMATACFGLYALFGSRKVVYISRENKNYIPDPKLMFSVASIGIPTSLENIFWQLSAMVIGRIMLGYGELSYAANQIGLKAEEIALMPASSFGIVTVTLCGRAIGANNKLLGKTYIREIKKSSTSVVLFGAILLVVFPKQLLRILSNNSEIIELAAVYLRFMGLSLPLTVLSQIYMGALKSAGMAKIPLFVAMTGIWLIRVPLSFLAASFEQSTIIWLWVVVLIDLIVRFFATFIIYRRKQIF